MNRIEEIEIAEAKLRSALQMLKRAGCPKSADKVRSAIKSVDGALRHAKRMERQAAKVRPEVPRDWPVKEVIPHPDADLSSNGLCTCGTCGRMWDDHIATSMTPVPSGRCPFEYFH